MLPEMNTTEPYSPVPREGHGEAGQQGRQDGRQDHAPEGLQPGRAQAGGGLLQFLLHVLEHRLHRAYHEGQPTKVSATTTPSGVKAT